MTLKRLKADSADKDGSREAEVRKNLNGIMHKYGLVRMEGGDSGSKPTREKQQRYCILKFYCTFFS